MTCLIMGMVGMFARLVEQVLPFNEKRFDFVATIKAGQMKQSVPWYNRKIREVPTRISASVREGYRFRNGRLFRRNIVLSDV